MLADLAQVREDVVDALTAQLADHDGCLILALGLDGGLRAAPVVEGPKRTVIATLAGQPRGGPPGVGCVLRVAVGACQLAAAPAACTDGCWTCRQACMREELVGSSCTQRL